MLRDKNIIIDMAIVPMYAKCGILKKAREVFDKVMKHNILP